MYSITQRPLTDRERRLFARYAGYLRRTLREDRRSSLRRLLGFWVFLACCLWGVLALVDDPPGPAILTGLIIFWVILGYSLVAHLLTSDTREKWRHLARLERMLQKDLVQEVRVASEAIHLHVDQCGWFWACQVEPDRVVVLRWTCFLPHMGWHHLIDEEEEESITFNSDFSILRAIDQDGRWIDLRVRIHGEPIPAVVKPEFDPASYREPDHLEVIQGDLAHLEEQLTRPPDTGKKQT